MRRNRLRNLALAGVAATAIVAMASSATAQTIYIGPGGIGFGIGNTPSYRYSDPFYYGPGDRYRRSYDPFGPSYSYRYGRDIDDFDTYDWLRLGLGLTLTPRYQYYGGGTTYLYTTPRYTYQEPSQSDALARPPRRSSISSPGTICVG